MPPRLDLVGQKFGRLTVVSFDSVKKRKTYWNCICECGKKTITMGKCLTNGHTKSCGCYKHETHFKDLTGQKFDRLLVKEYIGSDKKNRSLYLCECDCGKRIIVSRDSLTTKNTKSCGCLLKEKAHETHFKDLTGQKFGRLFVKEYKGLDKNKNSVFLCVCDCGTTNIAVRGFFLRNGHTQSCGCYHKEKISGKNNHFFIDGRSFEPYCPKWTKELRKRIRSFFNGECVICGKTEIENGKQLSCHHVEYNKKACCDGKPVHFAALCNSCHSKTNKNRERWEAMLHKIIDEIYDGKSYYTREEYEHSLP